MPKVIEERLKVEIDEGLMKVVVQAVKGKEVLDRSTYSWLDLPDGIKDKIQLKGLATILQQRASDIKEDPMRKLDAMDEVYDRWVETGEYEKPRQGGTRVVAPIIEVLANLKGASPAAIQKSWSKLDEDQKEAIVEKYAKEIDEVKKARDKAEVDLSDLI